MRLSLTSLFAFLMLFKPVLAEEIFLAVDRSAKGIPYIFVQKGADGKLSALKLVLLNGEHSAEGGVSIDFSTNEVFYNRAGGFGNFKGRDDRANWIKIGVLEPAQAQKIPVHFRSKGISETREVFPVHIDPSLAKLIQGTHEVFMDLTSLLAACAKS